jgi:hypothetical protein
LKTLFAIGPDTRNDNDTLLIELGQDHCIYGFVNEPAKSFSMIRYLSFNEQESMEELEILVKNLKVITDGRVVFSSAYTPALLVPQKYSDRKLLLFDTFFDLSAYKQYSDNITEWQIVTVYSVPETINNIMINSFPSMQVCHTYTTAIKTHESGPNNQIYVHFTTNYFRIIVKKEKQVLLAQTYTYKTPLDVVYYLLKIVYEFNLGQSEVILIISGLIEEHSAMYQELQNYFLNVQFPQSPGFVVPENEFPPYYFNSLYNLAECVS